MTELSLGQREREMGMGSSSQVRRPLNDVQRTPSKPPATTQNQTAGKGQPTNAKMDAEGKN